MRYLKPHYLYSLRVTLHTIAQANGEGDSFEPRFAQSKEMACLEAAAARPRSGYEGHEKYQAFFAKVAALGHGIAAGHCFGNGNKRTAFLCMTQMMHANGWFWDAPPDIIAFVMLRTASNISGMDVPEIAALIGAYAVQLEGKTLNSYRHMSDDLVNHGLAEVVDPDEFPAHVTVKRETYQAEATVAMRKHIELMPGDERTQFEKTFRWPQEMDAKIRRWYDRMIYRWRVQRRYIQARRKKRFGKRRCCHLGGRSVPRRS